MIHGPAFVGPFFMIAAVFGGTVGHTHHPVQPLWRRIMMTIARAEPQRVSLGEDVYAVDRHWARWPEHVAQGFISALAVASDERVYVLQRGATPIVVFDVNGDFVTAWGDDLIADGHGIWATGDGRLFIADRDAHEIIVTDLDGAVLQRLGNRHQPADGAPFNHPTHASQSLDGDIYVADGYGGTCLHRFDGDGQLIASIGSAGQGPGAFSTPHATWALHDRVLVADRENNRVQVFDRHGAHMMDWGGLYHPMAIYVDAAGFAFVSDQTPRIIKYAPDGQIVGRCRGAINGAHGLYGSRCGDLYLAELPPAGVTRLTRLSR
jgi:peptidylglycine monooxygenase